MVTLANLAAVIWLGAFAAFALRKLLRGSTASIWLITLVFVALCGVPLLLDLVVGRPSYELFSGFLLASRDELTCVLYCLYVCLIPLLWWGVAGRREAGSLVPSENVRAQWSAARRVRWILALVAPTPILLWLLAPDPGLYSTYAMVINTPLTPEEVEHHALLAASVKLSMLCLAGLLATANRCVVGHLVLYLVSLLPLHWLDGKRNSVALGLLLLLGCLWFLGRLRGIRLPIVATLLALLFAAFSIYYQENVRGIGGEGVATRDERYDNIRVDYGRDDVIKMAIYCELNPEMCQILDYRGQSLLFYLTVPVPREVWPEKPWPYAVYATRAALLTRREGYLGWGVTTSWLEEAIANLGIAGFLVGPLLIALLCYVGDSAKHPLVSVVTVLVATLFLTVQLVAFWPLFVVWLLLVVLMRCPKSRPGLARRRLAQRVGSGTLPRCLVPGQATPVGELRLVRPVCRGIP